MILPPCFRIDAGFDLSTNQVRHAAGTNSSFARTDSRRRLSPRLMISYDCSPPWKTDIAKAESGHC